MSLKPYWVLKYVVQMQGGCDHNCPREMKRARKGPLHGQMHDLALLASKEEDIFNHAGYLEDIAILNHLGYRQI